MGAADVIRKNQVTTHDDTVQSWYCGFCLTTLSYFRQNSITAKAKNPCGLPSQESQITQIANRQCRIPRLSPFVPASGHLVSALLEKVTMTSSSSSKGKKLSIKTKVAGGATGAVLGAVVGGPVGAVLGGVLGTVVGAAAQGSKSKRTAPQVRSARTRTTKRPT